VLFRSEERLNSFDLGERTSALREIASGAVTVPPVKEEVNLHYHTFFSFNANGWSPSRIAWEARKYGLEVAGIVDFDVLDGMDEFLAAGEMLGLKAVVGMESRVFISELADKVTSSPNEPGISYFMAGGCYKMPPAGSEAERILLDMARTARARNLALLDRVNPYLDQVQLDYDEDAIPLTPAGNVTERHLLTAFDRKAREVLGDMDKVAGFWAGKLGISKDEAVELVPQTPKFHEKLRSKLMKFGGVGYIPPTSGSFPSIEDAIKMMLGMDALPMATWLDGTNAGEEDAVQWLDLLRSKGCVALNIIPDRNWNIKNPDEKALKTLKLREVVEAARRFDMPICVGTEMNKAGLPFVDNFQAPELLPYAKDFVEGARFFYGHTVLARYADFGYFSPAADATFGGDTKAKNAFYAQIGTHFWTEADRAGLEGADDPRSMLALMGEM
jgi:hypothetical protein